MAKKKVYKGGRVPAPKQGPMGARLREFRKTLRKFGGRKR